LRIHRGAAAALAVGSLSKLVGADLGTRIAGHPCQDAALTASFLNTRGLMN
jgi:hypothetical protein